MQFLPTPPKALPTLPFFSQQNIIEFEFIHHQNLEFKEGAIKKIIFNDKQMMKGEHLSCVPFDGPVAQLSQ